MKIRKKFFETWDKLVFEVEDREDEF